MSKARYSIAVTLFVICAFAGTTCGFLNIFFEDLFSGIFAGYFIGAIIAELIFWTESFAVRAFLFFANIARIIFVYWYSFLFEGNIFTAIIALAVASPVLTAALGIFTFSLGVGAFLAAILFIFHLFIYPAYLD